MHTSPFGRAGVLDSRRGFRTVGGGEQDAQREQHPPRLHPIVAPRWKGKRGAGMLRRSQSLAGGKEANRGELGQFLSILDHSSE